MNKILPSLLAVLFVFSFYPTHLARAESEAPSAGPAGEVRGSIINQNTGEAVSGSLEVMLHVLDRDFAEKDMKHVQSELDGTFVFADVPFDANLQFAVMATYEGVTYSSKTAPADTNLMQVVIDVPVFENTADLTGVQVDEMHVLFDFAEDGLETREIYVISSSSARTVKDVFPLEDDRSATLKFPLPADADYIFFKPEDQDRFFKFSAGFSDTYPILPDTVSQLMVSYLVPYNGSREYTYTAPLNIAQINFLVPEQMNVSLQGPGLTESESMTLQNGEPYRVYSYSELDAGQTVRVSIAGKIAAGPVQQKDITSKPLAIGVAFLGFAVIGLGVWWWRRLGNTENENNDAHSNETTLDELVLKIAQLDEEYERGQLSPEAHQQLRQDLMRRAKDLL